MILAVLSIVKQAYARKIVFLDFSNEVMLWIIYLGVVAAAIGNTFYIIGVKQIGSTRASLFINFMPITGVFFTMLLLDEVFSPVYLLASLVIFIGISIEKKALNDL